MAKAIDEQFMTECLRIATKGRGQVSPNPMVGAILVKNRRVVSRGYHHRFGGPHAEVDCLRSYKGSSNGATLYVNLEPCAHYGKTPPCVDLIIQSGIARVVVGMQDPNPLVMGRGIRKLRRAGIEVALGVLEPEARELNRSFVTYVTHQRPFVHVKIAQTIDAKIAKHRSEQRWITGKDSRALVHQWRSEHDAVLVGAGTIDSDDPLLTVRMVNGKSPCAVIVDGCLSINPLSKVLKTSGKRKVIVITTRKAALLKKKKMIDLVSFGAVVHSVPSATSRLSLKSILGLLYRLGIASVLVEGGVGIFEQFLQKGPIDLLSLFVAPIVFGEGISISTPVNKGSKSSIQVPSPIVSSRAIGRDSLLQFRFKPKE